MMTCQELINREELPKGNEVWLYGLDAVEHCLQGDVNQTLYKHQSPAVEQWQEWREGMLERTNWDEDFQDIIDNAYERVPKWKRYDDDSGDFQLDAWLNKEDQCFEGYEKIAVDKPAVSVVYDMNVPWCDRNETYMVDAHRKVYEIAAQCEAERRPCRVVVVMNDVIPEIERDTLKVFFVIKDYNDPIFPAIWGTFVNNRYTNAYGNVVNDYLIGTRHYGNGRPTALWEIEKYFPEDEELIVFGKDLHKGKKPTI